jgi:hypothetical protein
MTLGQKGRAGFGASLDGMVKLPFRVCFFLLKQLQWPYSYDSCDVGTLPNQTYPGTQTPLAAVENGDSQHGNVLVRGYSRVQVVRKSANSHPCFIIQSMLPGQRLSACTCPGESHPGPQRQDGSYVGRSAPEIDLFEALVAGNRGQVSQSAQWAPFNVNFATQESVGYNEVLMMNPGAIRMAKHFEQFIYCRSNYNSAKCVYRRCVLPFARSLQCP